MADSLEPSIVCIMGRDNLPVGAGCLVTERHVVTCAHVVAAAVEGCDEYAVEAPVEKVPVEFFAKGSDEATVEAWWPVAREGNEPLDGRADLALLALSQPLPPEARPAKLVETDNIRHQNFDTTGFPNGHRLGVPVSGACGGARRDGRILVKNQTYRFEPGFSGAPVWVEAYGAVGGLLVERVRDDVSLAFIIPASVLRALAPAIAAETFGRMRWVPDLPPGYVARPDVIAELKATLLANGAAVAVSGEKKIGGLHGMGGIGKTVLASAVVRDDEVRGAFPDGIYWLTLGQQANAVAQQIQLAHELSGQSESFLDAQSGKARLEELLRTSRSLIVLDDVWSIPDARAFDLSGTAARLLLTTRDERVIEAVKAAEIKVPKLSAELALDMLSAFSGQDRDTLPDEAAGLVQEADGLPLALAMAGRLAQGKPKAWGSVLGRFQGAQIAAPVGREEEFPYESVSAAIEASVEALPAKARELFLDLAVFPEDAPIPLGVLEIFWAHRGLDTLGVAEHADDLVARSLASWDEEKEGDTLSDRLILHDLVGGYLKSHATDLAARHRQLIDAYRPASGKWADLPIDQLYMWDWLSFHLVEAGGGEELKALLLDPGWIAARLAATNVQGLLADYDRMAKDDDLQLVRHALTMSSHILARDKTQLAGQLTGRLSGAKPPLARRLLAGLRESTPGFWICPETTSLTPAGGALLRTLHGHTSGVNAVAVTPDGRLAISGSGDETLKVWELASGRKLRTLQGHTGRVNAVAVTPDGRLAISGSGDETLKVWELATGREVHTLRSHTGDANAVAVTPDGRLAISGSDDKTLKVWELASGREVRTLQGHTQWISAVAVTADGRLAISGSGDRTLKVWELASGREIHTLRGHTEWISAVAVTADGRLAISGSGDRTLKVWELASGRQVLTLRGHTERVRAVAITPGGRLAISGSGDRTLKVWELASGREIHTLQGHTGWVRAVAVTPDGRLALSASADQTLKVWELASGEEVRSPQGHTERVNAVAVTPDGRLTLSASDDQTLKIWELASGREAPTLQGHTGWVRAVAVTPDGRLAVSASNKTLKVWEVASGHEVRTLHGHTGWVYAVAVTPDGRLAISAAHDKTLKVWELASGRQVRTLQGHSGGVIGVAVTPDGRLALSASYDQTLKVWELASGRQVRTLQGHSGGVIGVAVTPDGRLALSASIDRTLKVWELESGRQVRTLQGHTELVSAVAVMPDGRLAISGSGDQTLKVWELASGREVRTLQGHTERVRAVAVTPDGRPALSASDDRTVKLWDIETGNQLATFTGDAAMLAVAVAAEDLFVAGSADGQVHILRLFGGEAQ